MINVTQRLQLRYYGLMEREMLVEIEGFDRIKEGKSLRCVDIGRSRACQYVDSGSNRLVGYE